MAGGLSAFLWQNAKKIENVKYAVSPRFTDEETGQAAMWEIRAVTAAKNAEIRRESIREARGGAPAFDAETYLMRLCAECTVYPNLNDAALQESYRVMGAPALIGAMLTPAEFEAYCERVMEVNGFKTDAEMVDEAKN